MVIAVSVAVAGCGSTVHIASANGTAQGGLGLGSPAPGGSAGSGSGFTTGAGADAAGGSGGASGTAASGPNGSGGLTDTVASGLTAASSTEAGPTGGASTASGPTIGGIPATGPGWNAKDVFIGLTTANDAETGLRALGISLDPGDEDGDAQAIVDYLNAHGGLFDRQVVLRAHDNSTAALEANAAGAAEANCTYFTQDDPVILVINTISTIDIDTFRSCLATAHTPLLSLSTAPFDDQTEAQYAPYYYNGVSVSWTALASVFLQRLQARNFFTGWSSTTGAASPTSKPKVGVLYGTDAAGTRDGRALLAGLKADGYATDYFQDNGETDLSSAVLRFEQDGVTHVLGVDNSLYFFVLAAYSQAYLPRYGVNTYNGIQALIEGSPKAQLNGAEGVGWYPSLDVDSDAPGAPVGAGQPTCLSALAAGGQTFAGHRFAEAVGLAICDGVRLAVDGAAAGHGLSPQAVRQGIIALGTTFPEAGGMSSGLSSSNFGLPGSGRDVVYNASCPCFQYSGGLYPV